MMAATPASSKRRAVSVTLTVEPAAGGTSETIEADPVLVSIGRKPYTEGLGLETAGVALDQITICLTTIPDDYAGELSEEIKTFKNQFGGYRQRRDDYSAETAFLHPETATESTDASASRRGNVKHNNNFYEAVEAFYESARHFWDEN